MMTKKFDPRNVVITGYGLTTPLGYGSTEFKKRLFTEKNNWSDSISFSKISPPFKFIIIYCCIPMLDDCLLTILFTIFLFPVPTPLWIT